MQASQPSGYLKILPWAVRVGLLKRGHGWLLGHLPDYLWGGQNVLIKTGVANMVLPIDDPASTGLLLWGEIL